MSKTLILLETKENGKTAEYVFIETLLNALFIDNWRNDFEIIGLNGKDNLKNAITAKLYPDNKLDGKILIVFDADSDGTDNGGYKTRKEY